MHVLSPLCNIMYIGCASGRAAQHFIAHTYNFYIECSSHELLSSTRMRGISLDWGPSMIDGSVKCPLETEVPQYLPIQVSVHTVTSRAFLNEMIEIFSHIEWNSHKEVVVVCTMQHAVMELVKMGPEVENEKDRLLENVNFAFLIYFMIGIHQFVIEKFVEFAKDLCQKIITLGYFADYFDPCSGLPV